MSKHTPGPWTIGEISECGQQVEINTGPDKEFGIPAVWRGMATFYGCEDNPELGAKKALANATLAIAAPDLLKELSWIRKFFQQKPGIIDTVFIVNMDGTEVREWMDKVDAIIAKAGGAA